MGRFTYVNVGDPGSLGDAACWNKSPLYLNLATALSLPPDVATFMIVKKSERNPEAEGLVNESAPTSSLTCV